MRSENKRRMQRELDLTTQASFGGILEDYAHPVMRESAHQNGVLQHLPAKKKIK